jgi:hypothetical protein
MKSTHIFPFIDLIPMATLAAVVAIVLYPPICNPILPAIQALVLPYHFSNQALTHNWISLLGVKSRQA